MFGKHKPNFIWKYYQTIALIFFLNKVHIKSDVLFMTYQILMTIQRNAQSKGKNPDLKPFLPEIVPVQYKTVCCSPFGKFITFQKVQKATTRIYNTT